MGQPLSEMLRIANQARLSALQVHGQHPNSEQSRRYIAQLCQYYPVLLALTPQDLPLSRELPPEVTLLLDAPQAGGGQPLDWTALAPHFAQGAWLAGGLGPDNVAQAIATLQPAGVDAVSKLECQPRVKDSARLAAFVATVRKASQTQN